MIPADITFDAMPGNRASGRQLPTDPMTLADYVTAVAAGKAPDGCTQALQTASGQAAANTAKARAAQEAGDEDAKRQAKAQLPVAVTTLHGMQLRSHTEHGGQYTGLYPIDIDGLGRQAAEAIIAAMKTDPAQGLACAHVSPSGAGIKAFVYAEPAQANGADNGTDDHYRRHRACAVWLADRYGIDPARIEGAQGAYRPGGLTYIGHATEIAGDGNTKMADLDPDDPLGLKIA